MNFVARNLKKIPRWDPNEIDSMAIVQKLKILGELVVQYVLFRKIRHSLSLVRPKQPVNQPKLVVKLPEQTGPRPSPTVLPDQQPNPEVT